MTEPTPESLANDRFKRVGVLGLGIMGSAIAGNLINAGRSVVGYDPDAARGTEALAIGVDLQDSAADVADETDLILLSLPDSEALDESVAAITDGSRSRFSGHVLVELSTLDLECKLSNRDRLAEVGIAFLDCPISGTGAQALTGDLAIYASGDIDTHHQCLPVFEDFARSVHYLGEFGQGTKMKFVANLLVAIHNVATAEALVFGTSCGLDADMLCDVIGAGAGSSRIFELRSSLMASGVYDPPTMKLDVWQKDMALIANFAAEIGAPTPLFSATSPLYTAAIKKGLGQKDTAAVCAVLQAMAEPQVSKT
jgi:3-hydroxyisobutyrate dehydrogenase-like beta-hydroxyacid dehydrogenase